MNNSTAEIYIHIPFCVKKCDYCDFLSGAYDSQTKKDYVDALIREIVLSKEKLNSYHIDTIFVGGGTPSILDKEQIKKIINALKDNICVDDNAEITIECNPGTLTKEKLQTYKEVGINRISLGLQSANDEELKNIGRIHSYSQFLDSYQLARKVGFNNINIDLMSALPGQNIDTYKETLEKIVALNPEHISAYSLIVEEGTPMFNRVKEDESILPNEDTERDMYYLTEELLKKAGYKRYEISNYSKEGFQCKHNIGYWKRKNYFGFGIGAASLVENKRYTNIRDIEKYIQFKRLDEIQENIQILSEEEQMEEFMFLGLRMMEGISKTEFEKNFNRNIYEIYKGTISTLERNGLLLVEGDKIRLTKQGIDISNMVLSEFLFD